jgi:hypothetical protein
MNRIAAVVASATLMVGCASVPTPNQPVERVDEGIYRIAVQGTAGASRREVTASWADAAHTACPHGYTTIEDHATTESNEAVGWNVLGVPVAPGGTKTLNAKLGYVRCDDSPYGLADATYIVRELKTVLTLPVDLAPCEGVASERAALRERGLALARANDAVGAFGCLYRAATFGKDFREGDAEAQFEVARAYERGEGTVASPMLARSWYRRAAVNGHAGAAFRLSELAPPLP